MPCADHIANRQKALFTHWKLAQFLLRWHFSLEEMSKFRLGQLFQPLFSKTHLNLIKTVSLFRLLDLHYLNSIQLHDTHWHCISPAIVHRSHSQFDTQSSNSSQAFTAFELFNIWESGVDLLRVVAINGLKLSIFVVLGLEDSLFNGQILKIIDSSDLSLFLFGQGLFAFGGCGEIQILIILDVLKFCLAFELFKGGIMRPHELYLATKQIKQYIVSLIIFSAYTALFLFSCSCSDFDNLAAFSSPTANDLANSRSLALGLGLDHLEKTLANLLVIKNIDYN